MDAWILFPILVLGIPIALWLWSLTRELRSQRALYAAVRSSDAPLVLELLSQHRFHDLRDTTLSHARELAMGLNHAPIISLIDAEFTGQLKSHSLLEKVDFDFPKQVSRRAGFFVAFTFPFLLWLGTAIYFFAENEFGQALLMVGFTVVVYLVFAFLYGFDLSTRYECSGFVITRKSWLPFLNSEFDIGHAVKCCKFIGKSYSNIAFYSDAGLLIGKLPLGPFDFSRVELWALKNLEFKQL